MRIRSSIAAFRAACLLAFSPSVAAKHFRWSSQGDASTMDPHSNNESFHRPNNFMTPMWVKIR